ncbi:sterile alpha motif domain-containing protein 14, partial [Silurus meridionalis]
MSSTPLAVTEEDVFDLTDAVPETERLDSSLQKAKAQLSTKTRRHRPSRSRLRDSLSSTEGEESLDGKSYTGLLSGSCSPLLVSLRCPSPFQELHSSSSPARKDRTFTFETDEGEKKDLRRRSACLLYPSSPTHLLKGDNPHLRQEDHTNKRYLLLQCQEDIHSIISHNAPQITWSYNVCSDDSRDVGSDEPSSPTVLLDKKTRRRFLDLGVTLRRTYGKVRRDRANRHTTEDRGADGAQSRSSRSSGPPFVAFSWLSERIRGSSSLRNPSQSQAK